MATVYRRPESKFWYGRVQRGGKDLRKPLKTTSRPLADKRLKKWVEELDNIAWGDKPRRTYDEAMESFLLKHVPTLKPTSQTRYFVSARMLTPHFEGKFLDEIGTSLMSGYEGIRRAGGAASPTIRRDLSCLSSMFTHVIIDLEWCELNPVPVFMKRQKRRGRLKESPPRTRYLDGDEEIILLAACDDRRLYEQIAVSIDTGLRKEEFWSLTRPQIRLDRKEILIPKEKSKNGRERRIPLLERSAQILAQVPRHIRPGGGPDWVWNNEAGERYLQRRKAFMSALKRAGLQGVIWHDLRRTCGCRLLQDHGLSLEQVRDWLGHESVQQTERAYAFLSIENLHKAAGTVT